MIYFTSDQHFYHENMIRRMGRPFANAQDMNETLVENWNRRVGPEDEVYILGDVTMKGPAEAETMLRRLHGRKYLIRGNHDHFVDRPEFDASLFRWVKDYHVLRYEGRRFVLFHYPIEEWDQFFRGAYHLHGHQHYGAETNLENRARGLRRYNVCVDANAFTPVSIDEIIAFFEGN